MWSYILIFIGVSLATSSLLYLDSRLFDKPKTKATYFKTLAMTNIITFATIAILTWLSPAGTKGIEAVMQSGGAESAKIIGGSTQYISQIGEDMLVGDAPF